MVDLGDDAGKGPRGSAVIDRLAQVCAADVRGNWDEFLPTVADDGPPEMMWWRDELRADHRASIAVKPLSHDLELSGRRSGLTPRGPAQDIGAAR